jgi:hypothetical protein
MTAVNTGNIAKLLKPGLNAIWGDYKDHPLEYKDLFETSSSDKAYEEDQNLPGTGLAPLKPEGSATQYDSFTQGLTTRYTNLAYSLGIILTYEAMADNQYKSKALKMMRNLTRSFRITKETVGANIYNRAHNSSYLGADGKVLCATDHPIVAGTFSNRLTTAADFSEAAVEDLCILISNATDDKGLKIALQGKKLLYPTALQFDAVRVLKSVLQNDTASNATNALRTSGAIPEMAMNHYFDDADAFFIRTDAPDGMKHFEREAPDFRQDNDFDTRNLKWAGYERNSFGWTDAHGLYSNGGGA